MIDIYTIITIAFGSIYAIIILLFTLGWWRTKSNNITVGSNMHSFSIIIPFYNEEDNILNLLQDIEKLNYPKNKLEVIMINNESTDNSGIIIRDYIFENNSDIRLHNSIGGKKDAVWKGINEADHDYILSIDADCRIPSNILQEYDKSLQTKASKMISGPVVFASNKGFWNSFMEYEFMSLVASGAGAIGVKIPIMVNAANMLFERKMAHKAKHIFKSNQESGDDIFLLQFVVKEYGASQVQFLKSRDAIVKTQGPSSFHSWVNQRLRWTAKAKDYSINATSLTALVVFGLNALIIILLIRSFLYIDYLYIAFAIIFMKTIIDLPILIMSAAFFDKKKIVKYSLIFELLYPFYIVVISIMAIFYRGKWKDES